MEEKDIRFVSGDQVLEGKVIIMPPNPDRGYNLGYSIFIPKDCEQNTTLIMHSCNTGNNVPIHLKDAVEIAKRSTYENPNNGMLLGRNLKMPVMIPIIPRIQYFYTQALRAKVYNNDMSVLIVANNKRPEDKRLTTEEIDEIKRICKDIPAQVVMMIEDAKELLKQLGIEVDDKIIAEGYSAGSCFANCFTALHPDLVKASICGGNNGLGILPVDEFEGQKIKFPLGTADIPNFDYEQFKDIAHLFYIGTEDYNDSAMVNCEFKRDENGEYLLDNGSRIPITDSNNNVIPVLDENGRLQPRYIESFDQEEIEFIHNHLGTNPQERFARQEEIYLALGINATFRRFPGNHNSVTQHYQNGKSITNNCIEDFIRNVLDKEKEKETPSAPHM